VAHRSRDRQEPRAQRPRQAARASAYRCRPAPRRARATERQAAGFRSGVDPQLVPNQIRVSIPFCRPHREDPSRVRGRAQRRSPVRRPTILLCALPLLMRSIVETAVANQPDLRVADCQGDEVGDAVARWSADVLIVEERADRSEAYYRPLLLRHPSLKVFILTQGGRNVTLIGFRRVRLADASPTTLIEAIRSELQHEASSDETRHDDE